jgi:hypothetical protein
MCFSPLVLSRISGWFVRAGATATPEPDDTITHCGPQTGASPLAREQRKLATILAAARPGNPDGGGAGGCIRLA